MPIRDIILLAFFLLSLPVCLVRPFYGVVLWTVVAFLNPQAFLWTPEVFPWAMAVAIPTLIGFVKVSGWRNLACRETVLILMLWAWFLVTTLLSTHTPEFAHHANDTWYRLQLVSKILLMTLAMIGIVNSMERLRMLLLVIAGCFGFFIAKAVPWLIITGGAHRIYGPVRSMIADNNDFGLALNMTFPIMFFLAQTEERRNLRRLFGVLSAAAIPAIFFTYSRGALVGVSAICAAMAARMKQKVLLIPFLLLALVIALFLTPDAWRERMTLTSPDAVDASARSRLNAWTFCWRLAKDYPLTGGGFATFTQRLFDRYAPNPLDVHGPHSVYFGVLAEHGFIGLLLYLALVITCFVSLYRLGRAARRNGDDLFAHYADMLRFSLIGFLVSGVFLGRAYFDYYFTIVACTAILRRSYSQYLESMEAGADEVEPEEMVAHEYLR